MKEKNITPAWIWAEDRQLICRAGYSQVHLVAKEAAYNGYPCHFQRQRSQNFFFRLPNSWIGEHFYQALDMHSHYVYQIVILPHSYMWVSMLYVKCQHRETSFHNLLGLSEMYWWRSCQSTSGYLMVVTKVVVLGSNPSWCDIFIFWTFIW